MHFYVFLYPERAHKSCAQTMLAYLVQTNPVMFVFRHCTDHFDFCSHRKSGANLCQNLLETHELSSRAVSHCQVIQGNLTLDLSYSPQKQQAGRVPHCSSCCGEGWGAAGRRAREAAAAAGTWRGGDPRSPAGCGTEGRSHLSRTGEAHGSPPPRGGGGGRQEGRRARWGKKPKSSAGLRLRAPPDREGNPGRDVGGAGSAALGPGVAAGTGPRAGPGCPRPHSLLDAGSVRAAQSALDPPAARPGPAGGGTGTGCGPSPPRPPPPGARGRSKAGATTEIPVTFHVPRPTRGILAAVFSCTQVAVAPHGNPTGQRGRPSPFNSGRARPAPGPT